MTGAERTGQDEAAFTGWPRPEPLDARQVFFVRHADHIRRWAALEKDVQESAHRFLTGIAEAVARRGAIPGLDAAQVRITVDTTGRWPKIALTRPEWPEGTAAVCLEWWAQQVGFDSSVAPYVGVLFGERDRAEPGRRTVLLDLLADHRSATVATSTKWWATQRRIAPTPDLVGDEDVDLGGYRTQLLAELVREWSAVASLIDAALEAIGRSERSE